LNKHLEVQVVDNFEKAIEAIQSGRVDVVVSETGDFLPGQCEQCARWVRRALNATSEGMVGVGVDGQVAWANAALRAMPQEVLQGVGGGRRTRSPWPTDKGYIHCPSLMRPVR
jgi:UDP-N-acetyl-D-mannosaminuronic acid transferase (WecB/TagA/CpsF family)